MKNIIINVKGLKCDNPDCNYSDMSIQYEEYEKYINAKCPKCGSILLTEKDYKKLKSLEVAARIINKIPFPNFGNKYTTYTGHMNGTGKIKYLKNK